MDDSENPGTPALSQEPRGSTVTPAPTVTQAPTVTPVPSVTLFGSATAPTLVGRPVDPAVRPGGGRRAGGGRRGLRLPVGIQGAPAGALRGTLCAASGSRRAGGGGGGRRGKLPRVFLCCQGPFAPLAPLSPLPLSSFESMPCNTDANALCLAAAHPVSVSLCHCAPVPLCCCDRRRGRTCSQICLMDASGSEHTFKLPLSSWRARRRPWQWPPSACSHKSAWRRSAYLQFALVDSNGTIVPATPQDYLIASMTGPPGTQTLQYPSSLSASIGGADSAGGITGTVLPHSGGELHALARREEGNRDPPPHRAHGLVPRYARQQRTLPVRRSWGL